VGLVFLILLLHFRNLRQPLLLLSTLPFAAIGAVWLMVAVGFDMSIAVAVGYIGVVGLAVETGVVMLTFLDEAVRRYYQTGQLTTFEQLRAAIEEGALLRLRPLLMTVSTTFIGLLPIMIGTETGVEVMKRIAAPMVGGLFSAAALTLVVLPALYFLVERHRWQRKAKEPAEVLSASSGGN
jgi:Cu(I)/Ag(I) efflux system membrane protein CusA/SilA